MKLQLALDDISLVDALVLAEKVRDYVDIFEIGSPFIIQEGMRAVREFRRYFPKKKILADTKIMDAGEYEAELTFKAGADYCTVLGVTDILTIKACLAAAKKYGKQVFVDTICVPDLNTRIKELE
ncbi:3-hexulose-6-phosphate synthase 2, partial [Lacticaseibacillus paracasei subsp. paracasei Lpp123]